MSASDPHPAASGTRATPNSRRGQTINLVAGALLLVVVATGLIALASSLLRPAAGPGIREFRLRPYPEEARPTRSFIVEFTLEAAGYPVLLHLDAEGLPSLLFPTREWIAVGGGQRVRLPDPDAGTAWMLEGEPGEESFLLAVGRDRDVDLDLLLEEAARLAARSQSPQDARRRVREFFARNVGEVSEIDSGSLRG